MKKRIAFIVLLLCLVLSAVFLSSCAKEGPHVTDRAGLLTTEELAQVEEALSAAEVKGRVHAYLYDYSAGQYIGEDYLREFGYGWGTDLTLLVITRDNGVYFYDLYTFGGAARRFSDDDCDALLDNAGVAQIKQGKLAEGLKGYALQVKQLNQESLILLVAIAVLLGGAAGGVTCGCIAHKYHKKLKSPIYPVEKYTTLDLTETEDTYMGTRRYRRVISSSSSSGGGGGGSSHGGGGGHRGGR